MTTSTITIAVLVVAVAFAVYTLNKAGKEISEWSKRLARKEAELRECKSELEDFKKREQNRKERELKKEMRLRGDLMKQVMEEDIERRKKHPRKKIRPLHGAVHNPQKK